MKFHNKILMIVTFCSGIALQAMEYDYPWLNKDNGEEQPEVNNIPQTPHNDFSINDLHSNIPQSPVLLPQSPPLSLTKTAVSTESEDMEEKEIEWVSGFTQSSDNET